MKLKTILESVDSFSWWLFEGCAQQKRTRRHLGLCVEARLHDGRRKTHQPAGERLARSIEDADATRQHLNRAHLAKWSDELVRGRLQEVAQHSISDAVVLIVDDTGIEKKGDKSPGVQRQYTGTAGKVTNCQIIVSTHLSSYSASTPLEMDVYLPKSWCECSERRKEAWIPTDVTFRTKPEVALEQIERIAARAEVPRFVTADAGYGDNTQFREQLRSRGFEYALGVSKSLKVWRPGEGPEPPATYSGRGPVPVKQFPGRHQPVEVGALAHEIGDKDWTVVDLRPDGEKPRMSRFARVRVRHAHRAVVGRRPGPEEWLLIEWPQGADAPTHYFLVSQDVLTVQQMAILAKLRWRIERDYQDAKQEVGLHHYEGRRWTGLNHHLTICMAAMSYLAAKRSLFPTIPKTITR